MTFGEAIRVGAAMRPTWTGKVFWRDREGQLMACVLGHAYEALTGDASEHINQTLVAEALGRAFPGFRRRVRCPVPECRFGQDTHIGALIGDGQGRIRMGDACWHLNDSHEWTPQQIADWADEVLS